MFGGGYEQLPIFVKRCFICKEKLDGEYSVLKFKANDKKRLQKVYICSKCTGDMEENEVKKDDDPL